MIAGLTLRAVSKGFNSPSGAFQPVLTNVALEVHPGERLAVCGRSGSGKSTLLSILGLFDRPDSGSYQVEGIEVLRSSERQQAAMRRTVFGFVFQRFFLLPQLTAEQNVEAALLHARVSRARRRRRLAEEALAAVGLEARRDHRPNKLSGGEQQRVAIARAIATTPRYVLADEPTGMLDEETAEGVIDLLCNLSQSRGCGLIVVTHDQVVARRMQRQLTLTHGRLSAVTAAL